MKTFTIDAENNITTHASAEEAAAAPGTDRFNNAAELSALAANWPGDRLVEIWNSLPGATTVKKFTNRKTAIARTWKAMENLGEPEAAKKGTRAPRKAHVAPSKAKATKKAPLCSFRARRLTGYSRLTYCSHTPQVIRPG